MAVARKLTVLSWHLLTRNEDYLWCACRKSNPNILMMQSAEDWAAKNVASSLITR
jgi:hypothetical protein